MTKNGDLKRNIDKAKFVSRKINAKHPKTWFNTIRNELYSK